MPRPGYKPQEPNGCSSHFLGLKVPGSVCTTTNIFSVDWFLTKTSPRVITNGSDHLWNMLSNLIKFLKIGYGQREIIFKESA